MKSTPTIIKIHQRSERIIWHFYAGTGEYLTIKVCRITTVISHSLRKPNNLVHLIGVCIPNSGNLPTPYNEEMRKYAELSTEVKQQWQLDAVNTLPLNFQDAAIILHTLHDVLQPLYLPDLQYVTTQICNLKYWQHIQKFLR